MEKGIQNRVIKQIESLCEKQYRNGFQQGFHASLNNQLTKEQVDNFRSKGSAEHYKKLVSPYIGIKEDAIERILAEIAMPDMEELRDFLMSRS